MPRARPLWPSDRVLAMKRLLDAGRNTSEIANEFGMTRNAVVGKVHRMGWQHLLRREPVKTNARLGTNGGNRFVQHIGKRGDAAKIAETVSARKTHPVRLCAWRVCAGNHGNHYWKPCGEPAVPGTSWCACHQSAVQSIRELAD